MNKRFYFTGIIFFVVILGLITGCKKKEPEQTSELQIEVVKSTQEGIEFRVKVPEFKMYSVETESEEFYRISPPNLKQHMMLGGTENVSYPEVPIYTTLVALPVKGEVEKISIEPEGTPLTEKVKLYPVQPEQRNKTGARDSVIFVYDKKKYTQKQTRVTEVVSFRPVQQVDANIFSLSLNLVDYDPNTEELVTYPSFRVNVKFKGFLDCFQISPIEVKLFKRDKIDSLFEDFRFPIKENLINRDIFLKYFCPPEIERKYSGSQFLIITSPAFLTASQNLRAHKISRGISTYIVTTQTISNSFGDGSGTVTDEEIKNYIKDYYKRSFIKTKWLLLMGDAEFIPTHYTNQQNSWDFALNAGDQYYGQLDDNDLSIPVFGIGRLPVDNLQQALIIVDKIIEYENNPPSVFNRYYRDLTFAAQFQDDEPDDRANRWFAETSEHIRNYLLTESLSIERIYRTRPDSDPTYWYDGTTIPADLQRPTFAWDGNTTDIVNTTNDGTSILYHRNHGWWDGWGTPSFKITDLSSINVVNNEYPVVFSINCASGMFDNETVDLADHIVGTGYGPNTGNVYWAETFIRMGNGAIGVIGDTRSSSTELNNIMAKGLFDAIFPNYDPTFGSTVSIRKLGDVLNHAKEFVSSSGYSTSAIKQENTIYNLLGDPTVHVRTNRYWIVVIDYAKLVKVDLLEVKIKYNEPVCLKCPSLNPKLRHKTFVVAQEPKSGRVISRNIVNDEGLVRLQLGDYRGKVMITFSSPDVKTVQYSFEPK